MNKTTPVTPQVKFSPCIENSALIRGEIQLLWHCPLEEPDDADLMFEQHIKSMRATPYHDTNIPQQLYAPPPDGHSDECVAAMEVLFQRVDSTWTPSEVSERFRDVFMDFDSVSGQGEWLTSSVAFPEGNQQDLIAEAAEAADDVQIATIGIVESWGCAPMLNQQQAFANLIETLAIISGIGNGIFLVAAIEKPNETAHEKIEFHREAMRWKLTRSTQQHELRLVPDPDKDHRAVFIYAAVQNMGMPPAKFDMEISQP